MCFTADVARMGSTKIRGRDGAMTYDFLSDDRSPAEHRQRQGAPSVPVEPRSRSRGRAVVRGIARNVTMTAVQATAIAPQAGQRQLLAMKLERYDEHGQRLPPVSVELRAAIVQGQVGDGDEVVAVGRWSQGTLRARKIDNNSRQATVIGRGRRSLTIALSAAALVVTVTMGIGFLALRKFAPESVPPSPHAGAATSLPAPKPTWPGIVTATSVPTTPVVTTPIPDTLGKGPARLLPNAVGEPADDVRARLEAMGLEVRTRSVDSASPAGTVTAMDRKPGDRVVPGDTVRIDVSHGITVPDLVGLLPDDARARLRAAGWSGELSVSEVAGRDLAESGKVVAQDPGRGTWIDAQAAVRVTVAKVAAPATATPTTSTPRGD